MTLPVSVLVAGGVALVGWRLGWLTPVAAAAALGVGTAVLWGGGWGGLILLGTFFVTGSLVSRGPAARPRTALQVAANGWTAAAGGLLMRAVPTVGWAVLAGGLAAAQADTWATEFGMRARATPVLLTTGRPVPPGTSGGVTWVGVAAGLAGAALIAALTALLGRRPADAAWVAAAGVAGMLADSLLGATVQARYACRRCGAQIETRSHRSCDAPADRRSGLSWMTNDTVNLLGSGVGAALAVVARVAA